MISAKEAREQAEKQEKLWVYSEMEKAILCALKAGCYEITISDKSPLWRDVTVRFKEIFEKLNGLGYGIDIGYGYIKIRW